MDTIVQVVAVTPRTTSKGRALYDVKSSDGTEYTVWEAELAQKIAAAAPSGPMTLRYDEKKNGQYTNRSVRDFAPAGQQLGPDPGPQVGGGGRPGFKGGGMTPEDKTRIAKMGAQGSAATLVAALYQGAGPDAYEEAVSKLEELTKRLYKAARSHEKPEAKPEAENLVQATPNLIQPQATTPQEVANLVPGVTVGTSAVQDAAAEQPDAPSNDDVDWT